MKLTTILILPILFLSSCHKSSVSTADVEQQRQTDQALLEALSQVGPPAITNWTELRSAKMLMELRDRADLQTHTYIKNLDGSLLYLGPSIGYGLPYCVQMTNPSKLVYEREFPERYGHVIPQAEPNGLFMPESSTATWIMLLNPETKEVSPVYVESEILVTQFKLPKLEYIPVR